MLLPAQRATCPVGEVLALTPSLPNSSGSGVGSLFNTHQWSLSRARVTGRWLRGWQACRTASFRCCAATSGLATSSRGALQVCAPGADSQNQVLRALLNLSTCLGLSWCQAAGLQGMDFAVRHPTDKMPSQVLLLHDQLLP